MAAAAAAEHLRWAGMEPRQQAQAAAMARHHPFLAHLQPTQAGVVEALKQAPAGQAALAAVAMAKLARQAIPARPILAAAVEAAAFHLTEAPAAPASSSSSTPYPYSLS
jgi:hypothetical protein